MEAEAGLSEKIGAILREKGLFLVTAESCSGGLLAHLITSVPGSSDYFLGGLVVYSNAAKQRWLNVRAATLKEYGAVSRETVLEMASGARNALGARVPAERVIALVISGIAGPGGGTQGKPVGLVWIALSNAAGQKSQDFHFQGSRKEVMRQAAVAALEMLSGQLRPIQRA